MNKVTSVFLFVTFFLISSCGLYPESSFNLSDSSRLPAWFEIPTGMSRTDVIVKMDYYIKSSGRLVMFSLTTKDGKVLSEVEGVQVGLNPIRLENPPTGSPPGYPSYEIITVNGVVEVIEHRRMEPVFFITDNAQVLSELGVPKT